MDTGNPLETFISRYCRLEPTVEMYETGTHPDDPDPGLLAALDADPGVTFEHGRAHARDLLEAGDFIAFWFQAVGDGSRIDRDHIDVVSLVTPHQVAHAAGYHDSLDYPSIRQIAFMLFAHHLGLVSTPDSMGLSPTEILTDNMTSTTQSGEVLFGRLPPEDAQYPEPTDMDTQRRRAISLLDDDSLTGCWLQVVSEESGPLIVHSGPKDPTNTRGEWVVDSWVDHPIEYVFVTMESVDVETDHQINPQYLAQHLYVTARTVERDPEAVGADAVDMVLVRGWIYESFDQV